MGSFLEGPSGDFAIEDHGYEEIEVSEFVPSKECLKMMEVALLSSKTYLDGPIITEALRRRLFDQIEYALALLASERQRAKTMKQQIEEMEGQGE